MCVDIICHDDHCIIRTKHQLTIDIIHSLNRLKLKFMEVHVQFSPSIMEYQAFIKFSDKSISLSITCIGHMFRKSIDSLIKDKLEELKPKPILCLPFIPAENLNTKFDSLLEKANSLIGKRR